MVTFLISLDAVRMAEISILEIILIFFMCLSSFSILCWGCVVPLTTILNVRSSYQYEEDRSAVYDVLQVSEPDFSNRFI